MQRSQSHSETSDLSPSFSCTLSVIMVSFNTAELTQAACESVLSEIAASTQLRGNSELLVIDNHSSDTSVAVLTSLAKKHHELHLIQNSENVGFARANNQGIRASRGKYLFLLNSDTVLHPGALDRLLSTIQQTPSDQATAVLASHHGELDNLGIVAAQLYNRDGSIQPQGGALPTLGTVAAQYFFLDDLPVLGRFFASTQNSGLHAQTFESQEHPQPMGWVGGTALLIDRKVLCEIGLLDENIFMYGEDVELCLRAQNHHIDCAIDPQAGVTHYQNASGSSAKALIGELKGYMYIWAKHKPPYQLYLLQLILWIGTLARVVLFGTIKHDRERARAYRAALKQI